MRSSPKGHHYYLCTTQNTGHTKVTENSNYPILIVWIKHDISWNITDQANEAQAKAASWWTSRSSLMWQRLPLSPFRFSSRRSSPPFKNCEFANLGSRMRIFTDISVNASKIVIEIVKLYQTITDACDLTSQKLSEHTDIQEHIFNDSLVNELAPQFTFFAASLLGRSLVPPWPE